MAHNVWVNRPRVSVRTNTAFPYRWFQPIMIVSRMSKEIHHGLEASEPGSVAAAG